MSRKSTIVTIEPPPHSIDTERIEIADFVCPYCCGMGNWSEQVGYNEYLERTCKVCKGAKKIKAVVTIGWLPDNNNSLCVKELERDVQ